jgi:hypothetical protein
MLEPLPRAGVTVLAPAQLGALKVKHEFIVKPGLDHGTIAMGGEPALRRPAAKLNLP